ncbi:hypothetical protein PAPYR_7714 [Paratrimastix pyriformis]|uniref:Uncharacterized protein n=1 Tax=Paratrimastix pyriformis TaxID=342808 RepID=A0ABQ8UJC3_9EUKA|nr:hypothetical protein PAPYR_7714 [Paratrimastix pyriformis]
MNDARGQELFKEANLLVNRIDQDLAQANSVGYQTQAAVELLQKLKEQTGDLGNRIVALSQTDPPPQVSMTLWNTKIRALERRLDEQRSSVSVYSQRLEQYMDRQYTDDLLSGASDRPEVAVDRVRLENARLHQTNREMEQIAAAAQDAFQNVLDQGKMMRKSGLKVTDVRSNIGISSGMLSSMKRRLVGDKWLMRGGMAAVLVLFGVIWWWRRSHR